jgi:hypothetical protein
MATQATFTKLAHCSRQLSKVNVIFLKKGLGECDNFWQVSSYSILKNLAILANLVMYIKQSSLTSPKNSTRVSHKIKSKKVFFGK